jgi:hypothetical protein
MKKNLLAALTLLLASTAFGGEVLIPAVYRGAGANNTLWRTEIVVSNVTTGLSATVVPVTITLHRDNGETIGVKMPLAPMEVIAVPDAVLDWFAIENGGGLVRVTWDGETSRILARARIYNVGEHGEYGQSVPGVELWRLVSENFLPGLSGVDGNRTNIGVSNPTNATSIVWIELFDTSGLSRGAFATGIAPRSYRQFNDIFSHFQAGPLNAAMVRVSSTNTPIYAYASVVRNDTGDATFVQGQ